MPNYPISRTSFSTDELRRMQVPLHNAGWRPNRTMPNGPLGANGMVDVDPSDLAEIARVRPSLLASHVSAPRPARPQAGGLSRLPRSGPRRNLSPIMGNRSPAGGRRFLPSFMGR